MSTQYTVFENEVGKIELDERSCTFDLDVTIKKPGEWLDDGQHTTLASRMTEDQVIDMAVSLLGPMFYFDPGPRILREFQNRLRERGYL